MKLRWVSVLSVLVLGGAMLLQPPAWAATPSTGTGDLGSSAGASIQGEQLALRPLGPLVQVQEEIHYVGQDPQGFKATLLPGFEGLQVQGMAPGSYRTVGNRLILPSDTQDVLISYTVPLSGKAVSWSFPIDYPTSVLVLYTGAGLSLPVVLNQDFYDMGPVQSQVGTFEKYATKPLPPDPNLELNLQVAPPTPTQPAGAKPAFSSAAALWALVAIIILVGGAFWYRQRQKRLA